MHKALEFTRHLRQGLLKNLDTLSLEQLNFVPPGFNNNVIWNFGHLISAQEGVCYQHNGLATEMDAGLIAQYDNGTKPEAPVDQAHVDHLKMLALATLDRLEADAARGLFGNFKPLSIGPVLTMSSFEDAASFLAMHEGMHYGYTQALKRAAGIAG